MQERGADTQGWGRVGEGREGQGQDKAGKEQDRLLRALWAVVRILPRGARSHRVL